MRNPHNNVHSTLLWGLSYGADDEARTRYLHLGKVALYQMSYIRMFCFLLFARNDIYYTA